MANALSEFIGNSNLPALSNEDMAAALQDSLNENGAGGAGNVNYLSFSGKTGTYALGRDKTDMDPEVMYLLEPQSLIEGWVCWKGNKPVDRFEWSVYQRSEQAISEAELPDKGPYRESMGEGWQRLLGFGVVGVDGDTTPIKFTATSKSGRNAIGDLNSEIMKRLAANEPSMPLIYFDAVEFVAQDQRNFKPKFEIEAWVDREAAGAYFEGDIDIDQLIAGDMPKKKKSRKKK